MTSMNSLLPRLSTSEPVRHTLTVLGRRVTDEIQGRLAHTLTLPEPSQWRISFDETTRPYASATLIYPTKAYAWDTIDPTVAKTFTRLLLSAGYEYPITRQTFKEQIAGLILHTIRHNSDGYTTLELASDEILLEDVPAAPGSSYAVSADATSLKDVLESAQRAAQAPYIIPITIDPTIAPAEINWDIVRASGYEAGENILDWIYQLVDAAGLWIHSNQKTPDARGLYIERREIAAGYGIDLTQTAPYPILTRSETTFTTENAATILDLTAEWQEAGSTQRLTKRYQLPGLPGPAKVARRTLHLRPPLLGLNRTLPDHWPPALSLLYRLAVRTWTSSVEARALYWLKPRDTVLTDEGTALIAQVTFNGSTGLMTLNVRPI